MWITDGDDIQDSNVHGVYMSVVTVLPTISLNMSLIDTVIIIDRIGIELVLIDLDRSLAVLQFIRLCGGIKSTSYAKNV